MNYYLGIDLGGTNIVAGILNERGEIIAKESTKTNSPRPAEEIVEDIIKVSKQAICTAKLTLDEIKSVGIGTPGIVNIETGIVEYASNLKFDNVPLAEMVEKGLGKKTLIENDANAAAYGEHVAGAGKGYSSLIAVTLGTGIGGGVIIDNKIHHGFNYGAAEFGHIVIMVDGEKCSCGKSGCFETYCSATGLINRTKDAMKENKTSVLWELCNNDLTNVNGKTAFDGMRLGDKVSCDIVEKFIKYLAIGVSNIINSFQPEILCIGGGLCKEGDTIIKPLNEQVIEQTYILNPNKRTKIMTAQLGNDAGIIGAAFLSKQV